MADKAATLYVVDLGAPMGQRHNRRKQSDLDYALQYVWDKITTTVANGRKTDTIGVVGYRTDKTDNALMKTSDGYEHIRVLNPIGQMLMANVRELQKDFVPNETSEGDGISAIVVALDMITTYCKKLKYKKNIYLITNGTGAYDTAEIEDIENQLKAENVGLTILGVDFDDPEYGFEEKNKDATKAENEKKLRALTEAVDGVFGTLEEAVGELSVPRVKSVRPTHSMKAQLTIGNPEDIDNCLFIDVERYPKTAQAKPLSASRYVDAVSAGEGSSESMEVDDGLGLQAVKQARQYQVVSEVAPGGKMDIEKDQMEKGYSYGKTVVHMNENDEKAAIWETTPGIQMVGFIPKETYPRWFSMSNVQMVVPQKANGRASFALSSLIHAMYELNVYAVARLVRKINDPPKMIIMAPSIDPEFECLYDVEAPFIEDVRRYAFPPLDKVRTISGKTLETHRNLPTVDMERFMSDYVDAMDISEFSHDDDGNPCQYAPPDETFNPVIHRINQCIKHRAIYPDDPLPPVPEILTKYANPPEDLLEKAKPHLKKLIEACDVKKVEAKVAGRKRGRDQPAPKSGLDVQALLELRDPAPSGGADDGVDIAPPSSSQPAIKSEAKPETESVIPPTKKVKVTFRNAIPEFKRALANAHPDELLHPVAVEAAKQMMSHIEELVTSSLGEGNYQRAIEMLKVCRRELFEWDEGKTWNSVAKEFEKKVKGGELNGDRRDFWVLVGMEKVGLLLDEEDGNEEFFSIS